MSVRLVAGPREWELGPEPLVVPAGAVMISVSGFQSRTIILDGRPLRLSAGQVGLLLVDLTRSTGYHRLVVDGSSYWFGTDDAKLRLAGIEAMLAQMRTLGTGWTGQALFSDGSGLRDVHVLYGWLDEWADAALTAADEVLTAPRTAKRTDRALSRRGGSKVLLAPTIRLIRSAPRQYLSERPGGVISIEGRGYDPLRVVVARRSTTLDTVANRRIVQVLQTLSRLCQELLVNGPARSVGVRCRLWLNRIQTLQRRPLAQALYRSASVLSAPRQLDELTERSYRINFDVAQDLRHRFGWSASVNPSPRFSYVEQADRIYQAYVASCLAAELGLMQTDPVLGNQPLAFTGPNFDLYYDSVPPPTVLRSWRAETLRPDASRPDLLIHERDTGRVALIDAKYRIAGDGGATEDSRKDVSAYLSLYGLRAITIAFPGASTAESTVAGHGIAIVELPLAPPATHLAQVVPAVLATLQEPLY